jgi:hypothetical protein
MNCSLFALEIFGVFSYSILRNLFITDGSGAYIKRLAPKTGYFENDSESDV